MIVLDNALHFIGSTRIVYRMAEVPQRISNHGIEEQLAGSATYAAFGYLWQGHAILVVRLATSSWGFDVLTGQWHERRTALVSNWAVQCAIQQSDGSPMFGSATGGELVVYSGWAEGTSEMSREFTAAIPLSGSQIIDSVEIECNTGQTTVISGQGSAPLIELRYSRDGGNTWSAWIAVSLGAIGHFRTRAKWRRLGMFDAPGALFHLRVTDPVPFRVSGSYADESSAGRARAA
jgi:hypothetical protein